MFAGSSPITFTSPSSKACQKSGPFAPPALPSLDAHTTLSELPSWPLPSATLRPLPSPMNGSPPITRTTFPTCRAHYPGGSSGCSCRLLPRSLEPSPNGRRVGIRIVTFEACSGFTHVTARRIAQPPKVTFVTRLRPSQLPDQAARQLPDQSTTIRVEPSSTDDSRLRGALPIGDIKIAYSTIWSPRARKRCATVRNDARNSSGSTPSASIRARTGELFGYLVGAAEQAERRSC